MARKISTSLLLLLFAVSMDAQTFRSEQIVGESYVNSIDVRDMVRMSKATSAHRMQAAPHKAPSTLSSKWIDRIQNLPPYLSNFYTVYGEKVREVLNGEANWLYDPTLCEVVNGNSYLTKITTIEGSTGFTFPLDATPELIYEQAKAAVLTVFNEQRTESNTFLPFLFASLTYDYPEGFWLSTNFMWMNGLSYGYNYDLAEGTGTVDYTHTIYLKLADGEFDHRRDEFRTTEQLDAAVTEFNQKVALIVGGCPEGYRFPQIRYFNNWLTTHNSYNSDLGHTEDVASIAWSPMSAFRESTGSTGPVCEGYARAFKVLCDKKNIPCMLVVGWAKENSSDAAEDHMWNEVQMEDGNWYAVDVTWNDPYDALNRKVSGLEDESWLLLGKKDQVDYNFTFEQSHINALSWGDDSQWDYSDASMITDYKYVFEEPERPTQAVIKLATGKTMAGCSFSETLDFSGVTNAKAWIASGFIEGGKVMLSRVNIVPANTGFIVSTETPGIEITVPVGTGRAYYANLLVPILEEQTIYPTQTIDGVNYTFMGIGTIAATGNTGFVKITAERQYGPNKCLLKVPTEYLASEARGASELEMVFDDETSSIDNSQFTIHNWAGAVYDLLGRRVNYNNRETITNKRSYVPAVASDQRSSAGLKPGVYIVNGKKKIVK